jgi:serine/threonine protein kinase
MAPELFAGYGYDRRTDLWALAVLCFECLYGCPPFTTRTVWGFVMKKDNPLPLVFPKAIPGIEPVLRRALAMDPADRYQSAEEFSAALIANS